MRINSIVASNVIFMVAEIVLKIEVKSFQSNGS